MSCRPGCLSGPGSPVRGLRVVDLAAGPDGWTLVLEGTRGRAYELELFGEAVTPVVENGDARAETTRSEESELLRIEFGGDEGRATATLQLVPAG